ncbi:MAG: class I SAM-dependent methyltransferase [Candidatus Riflebacteria bacterium]|nr:class I SAM-dependent methyltransferase [Candidatus Riflebacteria bacterium]
MTDLTIDYYEQNASELGRRYETTALDTFHGLLQQNCRPGARLLEIGCGSGRDAARAIAAGFRIAAIDGAENLLKEAVRLHPELAGCLHHLLLPARLPFADASFDGFFSVACLMHFNENAIGQILSEASRVTVAGGSGLVSVPAGRSDIDAGGLDQHGRVFNVMPADNWVSLCRQHGFTAETGPVEPDSLGRPGISWVTFILKKN